MGTHGIALDALSSLSAMVAQYSYGLLRSVLAVLQRFCGVQQFNSFAASQVRDGARHFQRAVD